MDKKQLETEEVEIRWDGKPVKVVVRELGFLDVEEITSKATSVKATGKTALVDFNQTAYNTGLLIKGIMTAPFQVNHDTLRQIRNKDGKAMLEAIKRLSGIADEEKKDLGQESASEN